MQSVLQLLGTVEEEALFRLCDLIVDRDTAGALTFVEELSEQGHDLGRLVTELIEHLRHLMLVQHMGEVPESLPVTEETRERLRAQANQVGEPTVVRLLDLLAVAVDDMRQGGDPRLPLELALVKVTRPGVGSRARVDRLPARAARDAGRRPPAAAPRAALARCRRLEAAARRAAPAARPPSRRAARRSSSSSCRRRGSARSSPRSRRSRSRSRPSSARRGPPSSSGNTLTVEFPASASFHRQLAEEPKNMTLLADALYEVTGRRLALEFAVGDGEGEEGAERRRPGR